MSTIYSKRDFNDNILPVLSTEVFRNCSILEIIKFLENEYNEYPINDWYIKGWYIKEDSINDSNEKILLDFNNELINKYLVQYCKSENTFYYLLELDDRLINQAIYNLNISFSKIDKLLAILIKKQDLLRVYLTNSLLNYKKNPYFSYTIIPLINKENRFKDLTDENHINLLHNILPMNEFKNIIQKEKDDNDICDTSELEISIWNLLCNLDVNLNTIKLFSSISINNYDDLDNGYKSMYSVEEILEKWSNYDYKSIDGDEYTSYANYKDKINIQMLISAFADLLEFKKELILKYDGVKAFIYKYRHWSNFLEESSSNENSYNNYIKTNILNNERQYIERDGSINYFFALNKDNYDEEYFKIFSKYFEPDKKLVIKYFEKIGSGITEYKLWQIEDILDDESLTKEEKKYYFNLYFDQVDKKKLINKINNIPTQKEFNNLKSDIQYLKNKKDFLLYLLIVIIIGLLILKF